MKRPAVYDSATRKHPAIEELFALLQYRDLIYQFVRRDIVARYKRSVLGVAWTMLNPLGIMLVMTVVFSNVFGRVESYPVYLLVGLITWTSFSQSTSTSMNSMVWGSKLLQQIYLPSTSFVVSTIFASLVNFALSIVPLLIIMLVTGVMPQWPMLLVPLAMILLGMFSLGIGFLMATLAAFFPDVTEFYPVLMRAWMYISPIIVPETVLQEVLDGWLLKLNPFYYILNIFRELIYYGTFPSGLDWAIAAAIALISLVIGWVVFTKKADAIAYYV